MRIIFKTNPESKYVEIHPKYVERQPKYLESTIRRRAARKGYILKKGRVRKTKRVHFGEYKLIHAGLNLIVMGANFDASLKEIAAFLELRVWISYA